MSQSTTLNLSIPVKLKKQAKRQAKNRAFSSTSDYLQSLIRKDLQKEKEMKQFENFINKGLDSGDSDLTTVDELHDWMVDVIDNTK